MTVQVLLGGCDRKLIERECTLRILEAKCPTFDRTQNIVYIPYKAKYAGLQYIWRWVGGDHDILEKHLTHMVDVFESDGKITSL